MGWKAKAERERKGQWCRGAISVVLTMQSTIDVALTVW